MKTEKNNVIVDITKDTPWERGVEVKGAVLNSFVNKVAEIMAESTFRHFNRLPVAKFAFLVIKVEKINATTNKSTYLNYVGGVKVKSLLSGVLDSGVIEQDTMFCIPCSQEEIEIYEIQIANYTKSNPIVSTENYFGR